MKRQSKKQKLSQETPAHLTGSGKHGAYDQPIPLVSEPSRSGRHSGRAVPKATKIGFGDDYAASAENGGEVNAQTTDRAVPSVIDDVKNLPRFQRGSAAVEGTPAMGHGTYGPNGEELGESPAIVAHFGGAQE